MVAQKWNQFMGYAQHDAQEFMAFLLDGLHEVGTVAMETLSNAWAVITVKLGLLVKYRTV